MAQVSCSFRGSNAIGQTFLGRSGALTVHQLGRSSFILLLAVQGCSVETTSRGDAVRERDASDRWDDALPSQEDSQAAPQEALWPTADAQPADVDAQPDDTRHVDCAADQTCCPVADAGAPQFYCQSGNSYICDERGGHVYQTCIANAPERCDSDGTRATNPNYGRCVDNRPYVMCADGRRSASNDCPQGVAASATARQILAQPIIPEHSGRLTRLGLRSAAVAAGDSVWLSLHADRDGQPGELINRTPTAIALSENAVNFAPTLSLTSAATAMSAGTRYWLVATVNSGTPSVLVQSESVPAGAYRRGMVAAGSLLTPGDMSEGMTSLAEGQISLFAELQRGSSDPFPTNTEL
jgi:hypothetical protein